MPDIKTFNFESMATITTTAEYVVRAESKAGDQLTMGVWVTTATGSDSAAYATDGAIYWSVDTDVIPRYAYVDFDESKTMNDLLDTGGMSALVLKMTDGAAGATVVVNEEFVMRAIDFRSS